MNNEISGNRHGRLQSIGKVVKKKEDKERKDSVACGSTNPSGFPRHTWQNA